MTFFPTSRRVVFVNRFYWPDELATAQLLTDLAEALAAHGSQVLVIASRDGTASMPAHEARHGVEIVRVRSTRWGHLGMVAKAADYLTFALAVWRVLRAWVRPGDWLIAMTDPPALAPIAASVSRRANASLVHWLQDIHPEISLALTNSRLLPALSGPWMRWRDAAWRSAIACVAISRDMAGLVGERGISTEHLRVIPNWAPGGETLAPVPPAENALRHAWGVADKFVVAYSGNFGRVHALELVLAAAALLRNESNLVFLLIGDGPRRAALEAMARTQGLSNVRFLPPQPRPRLAESLSVGDVHLVTLRAGCERCVFPSKLYGILAVARPVVFVGSPQCELAQSVCQRGAGLVIPPGDPAALAAALRELRRDADRRLTMAQASARWAHETGGLSAALHDWTELLTPREIPSAGRGLPVPPYPRHNPPVHD
jgi:glycosyltransferase involved in cell wall biosynthesis